MVIFPLIVTDGGWKDRRKLVFNIDAELGRHLCDVDAKERSQLAECVVELPSRRSRCPWPQTSALLPKTVGDAEELTAGCTHSSKVRGEVVVSVVEQAELIGQELADHHDRVNAVLGHLNVPRGKENPSVF